MSLKTINQFSMSRTPRANLLYCSVRRGLHSSTTKMWGCVSLISTQYSGGNPDLFHLPIQCGTVSRIEL